MNHKYDAIVIGAGQAGPFLAARFAAAGKSVAIIERHLFGRERANTVAFEFMSDDVGRSHKTSSTSPT